MSQAIKGKIDRREVELRRVLTLKDAQGKIEYTIDPETFELANHLAELRNMKYTDYIRFVWEVTEESSSNAKRIKRGISADALNQLKALKDR